MNEDLINRITYYLSSGGLFNPELADHLAVRNLLMECRDALAQHTWVNMTAEEVDQGLLRTNYAMKTAEAWRHGVEWAQFNLMRKNA